MKQIWKEYQQQIVHLFMDDSQDSNSDCKLAGWDSAENYVRNMYNIHDSWWQH